MPCVDACCEAVYREMLQVALAQMFARNQRIKILERDLAAKVAEIRRYVAMQIEEPT